MITGAGELLKNAVEASAKALYWVTIGPLVEIAKMLSGK